VIKKNDTWYKCLLIFENTLSFTFPRYVFFLSFKKSANLYIYLTRLVLFSKNTGPNISRGRLYLFLYHVDRAQPYRNLRSVPCTDIFCLWLDVQATYNIFLYMFSWVRMYISIFTNFDIKLIFLQVFLYLFRSYFQFRSRNRGKAIVLNFRQK